MLDDPTFFEAEKARIAAKGAEALWQQFFERNPWIFGYGLSFIFTTTLDDKKLEQVVAGASLTGRGKRVDGLLRTRGRVSSLCFVEIKSHSTPLLERQQYRPETWLVSREVSGAIAQAQRSVQSALIAIKNCLRSKDPEGTPTGEVSYLYHPKSNRSRIH
jgi:hypothetical protein